MIKNLALARKYATAFLNLFLSDIDEKIFLNIKNCYLHLLNNNNAISFFSFPDFSLSKKKELIDFFLQKFELPNKFKELILLLIKHNRVFLLPDILENICYLYQERFGIMEFDITTPGALTDSDIELIRKFLTKKTGKEIIASFQIDKNLIAGIRMQSDTLLWEYSIRKQLNSISKLMYEETGK